MANTNYEFIYTVEDYSGVSTGVIMTPGQSRWFDTVTGHDSTEVIQLTGDGTASIATLLSRHDNITVVGDKSFSGSIALTGDYDVIDTDSADVAATTPTTPVDGQLWVVVNSGTSENHVTGLPGTISLGDGKRITLVYDNTNTTWRYEDVVIDEYTAVATGTSLGTSPTVDVRKWAGGRMTQLVHADNGSGTGARNYTPIETFAGTAPSLVGTGKTTGTSSINVTARPTTGNYAWATKLSNTSALADAEADILFDGRWKTGV